MTVSFKRLQTTALLMASVVGAMMHTAASASDGADGPTIIILDASASMADQLSGGTRLDAAKRAAVEAMDLIHDNQPDHPTALLAFYDGCWVDQMVMEAPLRRVHSEMRNSINTLQTRQYGHTPIARSLRMAAELLAGRRGSILLVSDGQESCDEEIDLCAFAKDLKVQNASLQVSIVGLALSADQADALRCTPENTSGVFLRAESGEDLKEALGIIAQQAIEPLAPKCLDNRGGLLAKWCPN